MIALHRWWILKEPDREGEDNTALSHGPVLAFSITAWYCSLVTKETMMTIRQLYNGKMRLREKALIINGNEPEDKVVRTLYRSSDEIEIAAYLL